MDGVEVCRPLRTACFASLIRMLPRSALFPYTTLFRSDSSRESLASWRCWPARRSAHGPSRRRSRRSRHPSPTPVWSCRSEEHTSELQSQSNLVCRLLLEKKNIVEDDDSVSSFIRQALT